MSIPGYQATQPVSCWLGLSESLMVFAGLCIESTLQLLQSRPSTLLRLVTSPWTMDEVYEFPRFPLSETLSLLVLDRFDPFESGESIIIYPPVS